MAQYIRRVLNSKNGKPIEHFDYKRSGKVNKRVPFDPFIKIVLFLGLLLAIYCFIDSASLKHITLLAKSDKRADSDDLHFQLQI